MTRKEFLNAVAEQRVNEEVAAFAAMELEKIAVASEKAKAKRNEKTTAENAELIEKVADFLREQGAPVTASVIGEALEVSTSKATHLAKRVEGVVIGEAIIKNRVVKTYAVA